MQRCHCCAHDAGFILHLRRHNLGCNGQARQEFVSFFADSTPDNDQIGPEVGVHMLEILVYPAGPLLPAPVSPLASVGRRAYLRILATDFDMPQLCVRDEMPINKQGRADTRAQSNDKDYSLAASSYSKMHLGIASSIRIVEHSDRTSSRFLEQLPRLTPNPFLS